MTKFIEMIRDMFEDTEQKQLASFDESITNPDNIEIYEQLQYGADKHWNTLDIYRPKDRAGEKLPILVNVHGGAWIQSSKESYKYYCWKLAQRGLAVVNINYRLVPRAYFPAPVEDLNNAMIWVLKHAEEYNLDLEHIYGTGDSAGAQILGQYAAICSNEDYAKQFAFQIAKENIFEAIVLNCGVYQVNYECRKTDFVRMIAFEYLNLENKNVDEITEDEYNVLYKKKIDQFEFGKYITSQFPDTFLMTAETDFVKFQNAELMKVLIEQNVNARLQMYVSKEHELNHVFNINLNLPEAEKCNNEEMSFLLSHKAYEEACEK